MNAFLVSGILGCVVGMAGTALGGAICLGIKSNKGNLLSARLMALSAGMMLAVVFFSMIPESAPMCGWVSMTAAMILGAFFVMLMQWIFFERKEQQDRNKSLISTGVLLCVGVAIHNLPEGMAIGAGLEQPSGFGWSLAVLILLHNIPEGLAMAIPLRMGKMKWWAILLLTAGSGLPTVVGTLLGTVISGISEALIGSAIAFAAGAMLYLTVRELIPDSFQMARSRGAVAFLVLGIAVGILVVEMIGQ